MCLYFRLISHFFVGQYTKATIESAKHYYKGLYGDHIYCKTSYMYQLQSVCINRGNNDDIVHVCLVVILPTLINETWLVMPYFKSAIQILA